MQILTYFFLSISITFSGMVLGGLAVEALKKSPDYVKFSNFRFIRNDRINDLIGVNLIKWAVSKTFWRHFNKKLTVSPGHDPSGLKTLRMEMTNAEIGHLVALVFQVLLVLVLLLLDQSSVLIACLIFLNIFLNLYPALLQQRNKARLDRLISVLEHKSGIAKS